MEHEWKHGEVGHRNVGGAVRTGIYVTRCERHGRIVGGHWHTDGDVGWSSGTDGWRPVLVTDPESDEDLKTLYRMAWGQSEVMGPSARERYRDRLAKILNPEPETCSEKVRIGDREYPCATPMPHSKGQHVTDAKVVW